MHERKPLWLFPGLLSLNAPLVAMAWLYVFAKVWRVDYLPWTAYAALALAVWVIHVAARMVDAGSRGHPDGPGLAARHRVVRRCKLCFLIAVGLATAGLVALVVTELPISVFGYLVIGVLLVGGFFVISAVGDRQGREVAYGRNILAGAAFAYGTTMIAHVFLPTHGLPFHFEWWPQSKFAQVFLPVQGMFSLVATREFLTFALMCVLYFCAVDFWEVSAPAGKGEDDSSGDLALLLPIMLLAVASLIFAFKSHNETLRPFYYAILTAVALVYVINRNRQRLDAEQSRALADAAMLVPALIFHAYAAT